MAKYTKEQVAKNKLQYMTIMDFINKYHPGLSLPAVSYSIGKGKVDYMKPGRERFIVLTKNTLRYNPIDSQTRTNRSTLSF